MPPEPIRVWLVEDDADYRRTLSFVLDNSSRIACEREFADGEGILSLLSPRPPASPDVILLDIHLPGIGGIECIASIKRALPDTRIVMLTNLDDDDLIFEAFRAGASGYLLKNVPLDKITAAIEEASSGGMLMPAPVAEKVLRFFAGHTAAKRDYGLTPREQEVLEKMVEGLTQQQIGDVLYISRSTVNGHIQNIYEKLHVHSSSSAVAKAIRDGLV